MDTILPGLVSVIDLVAIRLKYLDGWDLKVLEPVVKANVGAEGNPVLI